MFNTFANLRQKNARAWLIRWAIGLVLTALEFQMIYTALLDWE
jgi:hypothetical protein